MNLGSRLRALREAQHCTLKDISTRLGITDVALGNYERNKRQPDLETLVKLSEIYNCTIDYLLGKTDAKCALYELSTEDQSYVMELIDRLKENKSPEK